jgi:hydroxymethylpyrimidine pyrophosphatase-like HAD family hydrolase
MAVEERLQEHFPEPRFTSVRVVASPAAERFNVWLQDQAEEPRRARLKRVYEVRLQTAAGTEETRYVLAKSVGWGWLGYHALIAGRRLAGLVPPVLGLRDGILFSEWLPQSSHHAERDEKSITRSVMTTLDWITTAGSYVAARARSLRLDRNPLPTLGVGLHHDSLRLLDRVLSRAYGSVLAANLMRPRLRRLLSTQPCPFPTLIDGKTDRSEWISGPAGLLKTDYEHHGMGKNELNLVDPAFDLAEIILRSGLSAEEESRLLRDYSQESGDATVEERLFLNKLLAGFWASTAALNSLFQPRLAERQQEFHQQFLDAWHFLTVHTARFCGQHCRPSQAPRWGSPLVVLDIDGVLDRRIFGFPSITAAGMQALAHLHAHDFAVALDTARSVVEVQEYCRAYGLAGGVAEYGGYAWDAVRGEGRVLVSDESLRQLEQAREALARMPGVFLDHRHHCSIRACTYEQRPTGRSLLALALGSQGDSPYEGRFPVPLPTLTIHRVVAELRLDRLRVHQTNIDTTITADEVDKGSGFLGLLDLVGQPEAETIAVGDSQPDLPLFRAARRSFAPAHIGCARQARALGCRLARQPYQRGLLEIVRALVHPDGRRCPRCPPTPAWSSRHLFLDLLQAADRKRSTALLRTLFNPQAYRIFFQ